MPSAAAYTNRLRFQSESRNNKIQYPGGISNTFRPGLAGVCANSIEVFTPINYVAVCGCKISPLFVPCPTCSVYVTYYDSNTGDGCILDGGDLTSVPSNSGMILDGNQ